MQGYVSMKSQCHLESFGKPHGVSRNYTKDFLMDRQLAKSWKIVKVLNYVPAGASEDVKYWMKMLSKLFQEKNYDEKTPKRESFHMR